MSESICDVTERLFAKFGHVHPLRSLLLLWCRPGTTCRARLNWLCPSSWSGLARYRLTEVDANHHDGTAPPAATERATMAQAV